MVRSFRAVALALVASALFTSRALPAAALGSELLTNGDFSQGNTGFSSQYTFQNCLTEGHYNVLADAHSCHSLWTGTDHTSPPSGLFMAVNGALVAGVTVWEQTVPVDSDRPYRFSGWVSTLNAGSPAGVVVTVNGVQITSISSPGAVNTWQWFSAVWLSGAATSATIRIIDSNLNANSNDFGLDDLSFRNLGLGNPVNLVCEDFHGPSFGSRWAVNSNGGSITFDNDGVALISSGRQFPFIHSTRPLIPAGDFTLAFKMKQLNVSARGTGFAWGVGTPTTSSSSCNGTSIPTFAIWQDTDAEGLRASVALSDPCSYAKTRLFSAGNVAWHRYRFDRIGTTYVLQVDGVQRMTWTEASGNNFPLDVWFGSPLDEGSSGFWTSLNLDSLRIVGYDAAATHLDFPDFAQPTGLTLLGSAALTGNALRLVPAVTNRVGAAFWSQPVPVLSFTTDFRFRITNGGGGGGDGLTFCVRGSGSHAPGTGGGSLGYAGIAPSAAVEIDIALNSGVDPNGNHLGIDFGGSVNSLATAADPLGAGVALENGQIYHVWVDYDGATLDVAIALDGAPRPPPILSRALSLPFATGVVGFTAATAAAYANHDILSWSFTARSVPRIVSGNVAASVFDIPSSSLPAMRGLPRVPVTLFRGGEAITSGNTGLTGDFFLGASIFGDEHVGVAVANERLRIQDDGRLSLAGCENTLGQDWLEPVIPGTPVDIDLPVLPGGGSGEAANLIYHTALNDAVYYEDVLHVPDGEWRTWDVEVSPYACMERTSLGPACTAGRGHVAESSFRPGVSKYRCSVQHESGHRLVIQRVGELLSRGFLNNFEADGLDEAFADYFTAAANHDPRIFSRTSGAGVETFVILRDLSKRVVYNYCNGSYREHGYYGSLVVGGALWTLRKFIEDAQGDPEQLDRAIFDTIAELEPSEPPQRDFKKFKELLAPKIAPQFASAFESIFADRNLSWSPEPTCLPRPEVEQATRLVDGNSALYRIGWTMLGSEARPTFRVYVRALQPSGFTAGLDYGELVADSLIDTTFTYTTEDTTSALSFIVVAMDSNGVPSPPSEETPQLLGVPGGPPAGTNAALRAVPNPSRGMVRLELSAGLGRNAKIRIYDVAGRLIRDVSSMIRADSEQVGWDGCDRSGARVPPGVYLIRATSPGFAVTERVVLMR